MSSCSFWREFGGNPFPGVFRRQLQGASVVDIDHALVAGGGDDHEAIALVRLQPGVNLGQGCEKHRCLALQLNKVRLLLRGTGIFHQFVSTVSYHLRASFRPDP